MGKQPVLFLDSGIGGIPYCRFFHRRNPHQRIVYLADRLHFPYGKWEKDELALVVTELVGQCVRVINPKMVVVACNTATLAALAQLRKQFPSLPFVGTVPAVKPAALASKTGKIGVLGTELTVKESYIRELAAQFGDNEIVGIAAPELVEFVEVYFDFALPEEKEEVAQYYLNLFREAGVDTLVLGCTHFLFLEEEFRRKAVPDIAVFESVKGISQRIETLLPEGNLDPDGSRRQVAETFPDEKSDTAIETSAGRNRLVLTGSDAPEPSWVEWADRLGFGLSLLGEI